MNSNYERWTLDQTMEVLGLLKVKKMTQSKLASEINVSKTYLNEVLNCKRNDPFIEEAIKRWVRENK